VKRRRDFVGVARNQILESGFEDGPTRARKSEEVQEGAYGDVEGETGIMGKENARKGAQGGEVRRQVERAFSESRFASVWKMVSLSEGGEPGKTGEEGKGY